MHRMTPILITCCVSRRNHRRACMAQLLRFTIRLTVRSEDSCVQWYFRRRHSSQRTSHSHSRHSRLPSIKFLAPADLPCRRNARSIINDPRIVFVSGRGEIARNHWERSQRLASRLVPRFLACLVRFVRIHRSSFIKGIYIVGILSYILINRYVHARTSIRYSQLAVIDVSMGDRILNLFQLCCLFYYSFSSESQWKE